MAARPRVPDRMVIAARALGEGSSCGALAGGDCDDGLGLTGDLSLSEGRRVRVR